MDSDQTRYTAATGIDLYTEWARAICYSDTHIHQDTRWAGGLLNLRPNRQGTVRGAIGVTEVTQRYAQYINKLHIPPVGSKTQPVDAGYLANGWVTVRHPDYDGCKAMLTDIGRTIQIFAT